MERENKLSSSFTLLEMLIVLSLVSACLILPTVHFEKWQAQLAEERFFEELIETIDLTMTEANLHGKIFSVTVYGEVPPEVRFSDGHKTITVKGPTSLRFVTGKGNTGKDKTFWITGESMHGSFAPRTLEFKAMALQKEYYIKFQMGYGHYEVKKGKMV